MFKKPESNPEKIKQMFKIDESDFVDLKTFMNDEKYKNYMDADERKQMIKNTLDVVIENKLSQRKLNNEHHK
jgi:hypothetical protein